jgi:hypothetical protein
MKGAHECSSASSHRLRWLCSHGSRGVSTVRTCRSILRWTALVFFALAVGCASGCGVRTVFVMDGVPVRVSKARGTVLVMLDGHWTETAACDLPEGWYLVHPSFVEDEKER